MGMMMHGASSSTAVESKMMYVTTDGRLFQQNFEDFSPKSQPEQIMTPDNVKVKRVWVDTEKVMRLYLVTEIYYLYQDVNDNIYIYDPKYGTSNKIKSPNKNIEQTTIDISTDESIILLLIDEDGLLYMFFNFDYSIIERDLVIGKKLPIGTRILSTNSNGDVVLEVPESGNFVLFPYFLYLLNNVSNNIGKDEVINDTIVFRLKNSPYNFKTTIKN